MAGCATTAEVIADLQPRIEIIVQEILNGIKEWNVKEINRIVYNYSPSWYERTYAFRDKMWDGKITQAGGGSAACAKQTLSLYIKWIVVRRGGRRGLRGV